MEKQFVTYEIALKMKELGYNEKGRLAVYTANKNFFQEHGAFNFPESMYPGTIAAPLWQQVVDWLRENYGYFIFEDHRMNGDIANYWFGIKQLVKSASGCKVLVGLIELGCFLDYYNGRKQAILKALELCKNN